MVPSAQQPGDILGDEVMKLSSLQLGQTDDLLRPVTPSAFLTPSQSPVDGEKENDTMTEQANIKESDNDNI